MKVLGIDIGGTGIKGAVVDTKRGVLKSDRLRILTPNPATPDAVADVVARIATHFEWDGPVGTAFPGVVRDGTVHTAANLDPAWVGQSATDAFAAVVLERLTGFVVLPVLVVAGFALHPSLFDVKRSSVALLIAAGTLVVLVVVVVVPRRWSPSSPGGCA